MPQQSSDASLVQRVRQGDPEALGALFDLYGEAVYRLAYRLLGSHEDAEDAVQDVFGGLPLALLHYEEQGTLAAWLRRVAARTALMRLRTERRRPSGGELRVEREVAGDVALRLTLNAALATLSDPLRAVFVLRMVEGYSHEEIAGLLAITTTASKVRLHRAVKHLRDILKGSL